jgi:hypothetical protein
MTFERHHTSLPGRAASVVHSRAAVQPTADEIDAAILAALAPTGEKMVAWTTIRDRVPGTFWAKAEAYDRLWQSWKIEAMKIAGTPYCGLPDALDRQIAAEARAQGRRVRDFSTFLCV